MVYENNYFYRVQDLNTIWIVDLFPGKISWDWIWRVELGEPFGEHVPPKIPGIPREYATKPRIFPFLIPLFWELLFPFLFEIFPFFRAFPGNPQEQVVELTGEALLVVRSN